MSRPSAAVGRCAGVIPVRMAASRFPGKPLAKILGLSMLEHVYRRTCLSRALDKVIVATCDDEILAAAGAFGAQVIMTSDRHQRAMERVAEVAAELAEEFVVMIQGDEPLLHPDMLGEVLAPLQTDPSLGCANLMLAIRETDARDPDQIKVACDLAGEALFMSREPLPTALRGVVGSRWRQIGVIGFRRDFLLKLVDLPATPLEQAESIDMLRALEHGCRVRMVPTRHATHPVDTPADITKVEALMRDDPLLAGYLPAATSMRS